MQAIEDEKIAKEAKKREAEEKAAAEKKQQGKKPAAGSAAAVVEERSVRVCVSCVCMYVVCVGPLIISNVVTEFGSSKITPCWRRAWPGSMVYVCMYANNIFTLCMYVCTVSTGIPREWPTGGRASPTT